MSLLIKGVCLIIWFKIFLKVVLFKKFCKFLVLELEFILLRVWFKLLGIKLLVKEFKFCLLY